jgi:hypothetical protein
MIYFGIGRRRGKKPWGERALQFGSITRADLPKSRVLSGRTPLSYRPSRRPSEALRSIPRERMSPVFDLIRLLQVNLGAVGLFFFRQTIHGVLPSGNALRNCSFLLRGL